MNVPVLSYVVSVKKKTNKQKKRKHAQIASQRIGTTRNERTPREQNQELFCFLNTHREKTKTKTKNNSSYFQHREPDGKTENTERDSALQSDIIPYT